MLDVSSDALPSSDNDVLALLPGLRETLVWPLQALAQAHRLGGGQGEVCSVGVARSLRDVEKGCSHATCGC